MRNSNYKFSCEIDCAYHSLPLNLALNIELAQIFQLLVQQNIYILSLTFRLSRVGRQLHGLKSSPCLLRQLK